MLIIAYGKVDIINIVIISNKGITVVQLSLIPVIDTGDWWGIHRGYNELVDMNQTCKGKASFRQYLSNGGNKLTFTLDSKGGLNINVAIYEYNYECNMTIESLDQTYLPKFIAFFEAFLERESEES